MVSQVPNRPLLKMSSTGRKSAPLTDIIRDHRTLRQMGFKWSQPDPNKGDGDHENIIKLGTNKDLRGKENTEQQQRMVIVGDHNEMGF
jgi:hypothetical protein